MHGKKFLLKYFGSFVKCSVAGVVSLIWAMKKSTGKNPFRLNAS